MRWAKLLLPGAADHRVLQEPGVRGSAHTTEAYGASTQELEAKPIPPAMSLQ